MTVTPTPIEQRHDHGPRREDEPLGRQVGVDRLEERVQSRGEPDSEEQPDHRRDEPDDEGLEHDRPQDLLPRASDRSDRGELAHALRDGDREDVEDDERADEQRHACEREQEVADELREGDVLRVFLGLSVGRPHLGGRRQDRLDLVGERLLGDSLLPVDRDRVVRPYAVEQDLCRRNREDGEGRRADRSHVAVLREPDEVERANRLQGGDLDRVPDLVALFVRGGRVDDDLVGARGPLALDELERIELRAARDRSRSRRTGPRSCSRRRRPSSGSSCSCRR